MHRNRSHRAPSAAQRRGFWAAWTGWTLDGMDSFIFALVLAPALTELLPKSGFDNSPPHVVYAGSVLFAVFLAGWPLSGQWRWRQVRTQANGQVALAFYSWDEDEQSYLPFALNVLTLRGKLISDVTAFITRSTEITDREVIARLPCFNTTTSAAATTNIAVVETLISSRRSPPVPQRSMVGLSPTWTVGATAIARNASAKKPTSSPVSPLSRKAARKEAFSGSLISGLASCADTSNTCERERLTLARS